MFVSNTSFSCGLTPVVHSLDGHFILLLLKKNVTVELYNQPEIGILCLKIASASKFAFAGKTTTSRRLLKFGLSLSGHEK